MKVYKNNLILTQHKAYILPDNYEIDDPSLEEIRVSDILVEEIIIFLTCIKSNTF